MNTDDAAVVARSLMDSFDLYDWKFKWDGAKRRNGQCKYTTKTISLSRHLTEIRPEEAVINTILHEIAHALVGPGHGHDKVWKTKAREIGCDGERVSPNEHSPKHNWLALCPTGHIVGRRYRRPKNGAEHWCTRCSKTYNPAYIITWIPYDEDLDPFLRED